MRQCKVHQHHLGSQRHHCARLQEHNRSGNRAAVIHDCSLQLVLQVSVLLVHHNKDHLHLLANHLSRSHLVVHCHVTLQRQ
jgi:hypothetical protein